MQETSNEQFEYDSWLRQIGELKSQFKAFEYYYDMGAGRSYGDMYMQIIKAGGKLSFQALCQMAEDWEWDARVMSKSIHEFKKYQEQQDKLEDEMDDRRKTMVNAIQSRVANTLNTGVGDTLSPQELSGWLKLATDLEDRVRR